MQVLFTAELQRQRESQPVSRVRQRGGEKGREGGEVGRGRKKQALLKNETEPLVKRRCTRQHCHS